MLEHAMKEFSESSGRQLKCFFLDIACQFQGYWDRFHEDDPVPMAIGPWHARVHKVSCQQKFGARVVENTGLTYGDNIEHLWAWLRKQAHLMKYMAPATRQDFLVVLMQAGAPYC